MEVEEDFIQLTEQGVVVLGEAGPSGGGPPPGDVWGGQGPGPAAAEEDPPGRRATGGDRIPVPICGGPSTGRRLAYGQLSRREGAGGAACCVATQPNGQAVEAIRELDTDTHIRST